MCPNKIEMTESIETKVVIDKALNLEYEINGIAPVQAVGTIANRDLYFRARHEEWTFDISNEAGQLPSDGFEGGFFKKGRFKNAGYMPYIEAEKIISDCVKEYLEINGT